MTEMSLSAYDHLIPLAETVIRTCADRGVMIATAESCTGGLVAAMLTEIAGSSAVVDRGFVTYSNEAKQELLGVAENLLTQFGAVSEPVAIAMAEGALARSRADIAVSVTGIAGPGGGSADKPVGTVHYGLAVRGTVCRHFLYQFADTGRQCIRASTIEQAFKLITNVGLSAIER